VSGAVEAAGSVLPIAVTSRREQRGDDELDAGGRARTGRVGGQHAANIAAPAARPPAARHRQLGDVGAPMRDTAGAPSRTPARNHHAGDRADPRPNAAHRTPRCRRRPGCRTPSAANVIASGTDSARRPAQATIDAARPPRRRGGQEQDAGPEDGADVERGGGRDAEAAGGAVVVMPRHDARTARHVVPFLPSRCDIAQ
jgi:hypothetical protein